MNSIIVTVGAVTYALKLKKLLLREGIRSKLVKVDVTAEGLGCSHGLKLNMQDLYSAVLIMKTNGFNYSVYRPKSNDLF